MLVERGCEGSASVGSLRFIGKQGLSGHLFCLLHLGGGILTRVASSSKVGFDLLHGVACVPWA